MFWFSGHGGCGILAPQPGIEPIPPALEGEVLTTGPPGKSQKETDFYPVPFVSKHCTRCYTDQFT